MKLKKAILTGALLWVLIFFEVSILMFGFKLTTGLTYYIIHYILLAIFIIITSLIYFNKNTINVKQGFFLGLIFIITNNILDSIITIPLFIKSYSFFFDPYLWLGLIETVIITTIIGYIKPFQNI